MEYTKTKAGNLLLTFNSQLVLETTSAVQELGAHESTMELFTSEHGTPEMIEWDCPELEMTEHIGLWFDNKTLTDYDGVFELPMEAIKLIRKAGFTVPRDFEN